MEGLSADAGELQLSIMHLLVKNLIKIGSEEYRNQARNVLDEMDSEYGNSLVVLLLRLEYFLGDPDSSVQDYSDTLQRIVCTVHLTDSNIKTVLYHVHRLRQRSSHQAHQIVEYFVLHRLVDSKEPSWMEKGLITMIWNCTTSIDFSDGLTRLAKVFDNISANLGKILSSSATHAAQVVRKVYLLSRYFGICHAYICPALMETHRN